MSTIKGYRGGVNLEKKGFYELVELMRVLRSENGCSWDKKQTIHSLKEYLLEESYETLEAMDIGGEELKGELGDLLLNIVFQSQICQEKGEFNIDGVIEKLYDKLVRRHPHIFGDQNNLTSEEVKVQWDKIKKQEKEHRDRISILDGIPKTFPAMLRAEKIIKKVTAVGFDWESVDGVLDKVQEEIQELKEVIHEDEKKKVQEELGDLIFSLINLSNYLGYSASDILNKTNKKFEKRFRYVESVCDINESSIEVMEEKWKEAKSLED